jgi:hypothetical protein
VIATERIERLLAPAYSEDLASRPLDELRAMCGECRAVETSVSYTRRLAQARIEILDAELDRRRAGGSVADLVARLPRILAGEGGRASTTSARLAPADPEITELEWSAEQRALVADDTLATLPTLDDATIDARLTGLRDFERELSGVRRSLHRVIDALEHEVAERRAADAIG